MSARIEARGPSERRGGASERRARLAAAASCAAAVLSTALVSSPAAAHAIGLSNGEYVARGAVVDARLTFARAEIAELLPALDADRDGRLSALEVHGGKLSLEAKLLRGVLVREEATGASCPPRLTDAALTEQDGLVVSGRFTCKAAGPVQIEVALLDELARGHRHVARAIGATTRDEILVRDRRSLSITPAAPDPPAAPANPEAPAVAASPASARSAASDSPAAAPASAWAFFVMGVEHILTGYDHLVFLLGLVLLRARLRSLLAVVTAFTVAHSTTLALAVLGVLAPSPRLVEPAIALSIAYVGIENLFATDGDKRWRVTFPFGLVHGFGFAGALQAVSVPRVRLPAALLSFNLGVEIGQLAVMAVVLPLVLLLRGRNRWFEPRGVRVLSALIAALGGIWFVRRIVG